MSASATSAEQGTSINATPPTTTPPTLETLPTEIRLQIFTHIFTDLLTTPIDDKAAFPLPTIMHTSRLLRRDAAKLWHECLVRIKCGLSKEYNAHRALQANGASLFKEIVTIRKLEAAECKAMREWTRIVNLRQAREKLAEQQRRRGIRALNAVNGGYTAVGAKWRALNLREDK